MGELSRHLRQITWNSWDGRLTREFQSIQHLQRAFPQVKIKDCSELIWDLRLIKSPAEIELMRKVTTLRVRGLTETMKATRPGAKEYELAALI